MKNSGYHDNQSKNTFKNLVLLNHLLDSFIILQECSLDRGLQNSFKEKNDPSKNMAFMGDSFSFYYGIE